MKKIKKPHNLFKNFENLTKLLFFTIILSWFIFNFIFKSQFYSDIFAIILILTALFGCIYSFSRASSWGFLKSSVGQSLTFIGFALLMWFIGQFFYYLDTKIKNQINLYEFFFIFIDPFYLLGMYFLAKAIGTFKYLKSNLSLILLPILIFILNILTISYLKNWDFFNLLNNFNIDDVYILGSIVLATFVLSILIFSKKLGGLYKSALYLILFGILFQFVADNLYAYSESQNVNGSFSDLLFFISIYLVTYGVYKLDPNTLDE